MGILMGLPMLAPSFCLSIQAGCCDSDNEQWLTLMLNLSPRLLSKSPHDLLGVGVAHTSLLHQHFPVRPVVRECW